MKEPNTIYVVTSGIYSDYRIEGVFSTKKKAEKWISYTYRPNDYEIEEYELDEMQPDLSRKLYCINIDYEDFNSRICDCMSVTSHGADEKRDTICMTDGLEMTMYVVAEEPKRALKVASERLSMIKAEEWRYPLLHTKCGFADSDTAKILKDGLRGCAVFPCIENAYPVYRFGSGEIVVPKGLTMVSYTVIEGEEETK